MPSHVELYFLKVIWIGIHVGSFYSHAMLFLFQVSNLHPFSLNDSIPGGTRKLLPCNYLLTFCDALDVSYFLTFYLFRNDRHLSAFIEICVQHKNWNRVTSVSNFLKEVLSIMRWEHWATWASWHISSCFARPHPYESHTVHCGASLVSLQPCTSPHAHDNSNDHLGYSAYSLAPS